MLKYNVVMEEKIFCKIYAQYKIIHFFFIDNGEKRVDLYVLS